MPDSMAKPERHGRRLGTTGVGSRDRKVKVLSYFLKHGHVAAAVGTGPDAHARRPKCRNGRLSIRIEERAHVGPRFGKGVQHSVNAFRRVAVCGGK